MTLIVDGADAEALVAALEADGAISTDIADADEATAREDAVFAEPGAEARLWQRCRVSALFPPDADLATRVRAGASVERVEDADWVAVTQRQFEPIRAGERLWIVPTWHIPPDPGAINIVLDPGAAFGTGSHPTTRMCLAWLEREVRRGDTVLDYGCGSGILAIAALKLGAARAIGVDIDPQALEAARYNSGRNGVHVELVDAQRPWRGEARVSVANILANPLRMLAPVIVSHTRRGGRIALAGVLEAQAPEVIAAYARWARLAVAARDGDWVLIAGDVEAAAPRC